MATIRAFTTIEQSRMLAEILPLETADMHYGEYCVSGEHYPIPNCDDDYYGQCCWSLAALLGIIQKTTPYKMEHFDDKKVQLTCVLGDKPWELIISDFDNEVDACVAMIEKLHELKMM